MASRGTSGFEGLRLLAREFSLRSRAEAYFFRTEFLAKTYKASSGVTQVSDIIRQIDVGLSRFRKMIETLPATVSRVGLEVQTSDLTIMLLRSLPHDVCSYSTLHAVGDAYTTLTFALLRRVLRRSNACWLSRLAHLHQVHEVCMHWKMLKPPRNGGRLRQF